MNVVTGHWLVFAKRSLYLAHCALLFALSFTAEAQQPKLNRVGVITSGGLWYETIDGLRIGLRQLGLQEGKHFLLSIRETKGDRIAAEEAAPAEEVELLLCHQNGWTNTAGLKEVRRKGLARWLLEAAAGPNLLLARQKALEARWSGAAKT